LYTDTIQIRLFAKNSDGSKFKMAAAAFRQVLAHYRQGPL